MARGAEAAVLFPIERNDQPPPPHPDMGLVVELYPDRASAAAIERRWLAPAIAAALHGTVALALVVWSPDTTPPETPTMVVEMVAFAPEVPAEVVIPESPLPEPPPLTTAEVPPPEPEPQSESEPEPEPEPAEPTPEAVPEPPPPPKPKVAHKPAPKPRPVEPAPTVQTAATPQTIAPAATTPAAPPAAPPAFIPPSSDAGYLQNPKPRYPRAARLRGMEGVVVLSVDVDAGGRPTGVQVKNSSGFTLLDEAALEAVRDWRFVPASRGGRPIAAPVEVPVRFSLAG